ncbi:hypothetical protein CPAR01_03196, partial [Colletotrichum paranaense]
THVHAVAVSTSLLLASPSSPLPPSVRYIFIYQCHHPRPSLRATGPDLSGDLINRLNATLSHEIFRVAEPRCVNVALHDSLPSFGSYLAICVELVEYLSQHSRLKSESSGRSIRSHRTSTTNKDLTPTIRALRQMKLSLSESTAPRGKSTFSFLCCAFLSFVLFSPYPHRISYLRPRFAARTLKKISTT